MYPIFEITGTIYKDLNCKSIKDYNGEVFPEVINKLINENKGKILFGGSSLIHDLYFKSEYWENRDYDLWCLDTIYNKVKRKLNRMPNCKKINEMNFEDSTKYYESFQTKEISEFYITLPTSIIKVQLINIDYPCIYAIMDSIDLSFNTVFYDGDKLIFYDTSEEEIMERQGVFRKKRKVTNSCFCNNCINEDYSLVEKEKIRISKYRRRGFKITNLCTLCKESSPISLFHCIKCWSNKLKLSKTNKFFRENEIEKIQELPLLLSNERNEIIILSALILILSFKNTELFMILFDEYKKYFLTNSVIHNSLLELGIEIGSITLFKSIYELIEQNITSFSKKRIEELFKRSCNKNYVNISKYISNKLPQCRVNIFEDKIISFKFLNIFEYYQETKDFSIVLKEFKKMSITKESSEDNCPICQTNFPNLKLSCSHRFCDSCLITYFSLELNKNNKLCCPMCRQNM